MYATLRNMLIIRNMRGVPPQVPQPQALTHGMVYAYPCRERFKKDLKNPCYPLPVTLFSY
jgi:hypothetical protein